MERELLSMYKFYVVLNSITRQVYPLNGSKLVLVTSEESEQVFYRKKLNGNPLFGGDDFKFFRSIENSFSRCSPVAFHIYKKCGDDYSLYWTGEFGMNNGKWNPDKCTVEFEIAVNDEYTNILKNAKTKVNILDLPGGNSVTAFIKGYNFEFFTCAGFTSEEPGVEVDGCKVIEGLQETHTGMNLGPGQLPPAMTNWTGCAYSQADGWVPYTVDFAKAVPTSLIPERYIQAFSVTYIRELRITVDVDGPTPPPGSGWNHLDSYEENGITYSRFARTPFGETSFTYNWFFQSGCKLNANIEISIGTTDTFDRNRKFNDAMQYLVDKVYGVDVISDFFSHYGDDTYPVNTAYDAAKANLSDLLIAQKSDIKDPYSSEPAWKGEMSFNDLQEIWKIFNCRWKIVEGKIRVEHESYWTHSGLFDLTVSPYVKYSKSFNSYEYEKEVLPKTEEFKFMEDSVNADFVGLPIEYDSICVDQDPDSNVRSFMVNVTTDITFIRVYRDAIANEGWVLMVQDGGEVKKEVGQITNIELPNNHLSWANLHNNYHKWGRVLESGSMNGYITDFYSYARIKKQMGINIPFCCIPYDTLNEIKTFLGTGKLLTMEENLYTNIAKIEVIHHVSDLSGSFEDRQFDDSFDLSFN